MVPRSALIGECAQIVALRQKLARLLDREQQPGRLPPVLIQGETGTGKGLLAHRLHQGGPKQNGPFVDVNCAAIPATLLEAELFGFERGAFTDARHAKPGLFQSATGGILFLDEVGLLPDALQAKLLKAIEEHAVRRLGSTRSERFDAWVVAATNEDLTAATREARFRRDLYHRLAVVTFVLPPLRDRGDDVLLLARHFLARACADHNLPPLALSADAGDAIAAYPWPGNVRELANVMERAALMADVPLLTAGMLELPETIRAAADQDEPDDERARLLDALRRSRWNVTRAADRLGLSRNTLRYRIEKYDLRPDTAPAPTAARRRPAQAPRQPPADDVPAERPQPAAPRPIRWQPRRIAMLAAAVAADASATATDTGRALQAFVDKVQAFGGRIEEIGPTQVVAAFGVEPEEDAPRRAALTAAALVKAAGQPSDGERPLVPVRLAIHVGQGLVATASDIVEISLDFKQQARLALAALLERGEPQCIAVSEGARPFLDSRFDLVPLGGGPEPAYRLVPREAGEASTRRLAPFVGRHQDLGLVESRLATAQAGHSQVVGISGEPGIGKSRLLLELRRRLDTARARYVEARCPSHGSAVPYLPLLDVTRDLFAISETDAVARVQDRLASELGELGLDAAEAAPCLLRLLGIKDGTEPLATMTPEAVQRRTFEVLRQALIRSSRQRCLVLAVEDLHWIDAASESFLQTLVEHLGGDAVLLVTTYRPGYRPPWIERSFATQMALQPLGADESRAILHAALRNGPLSDAVERQILAKAEGNPFFLEELARAVPGSGEIVAMPDTIQDVLLARVDRLGDAPRHLLQTAAVIGREVPSPLLEATWTEPVRLAEHLTELRRLEFIHTTGDREDTVHVFKHALTQEVAYGSLADETRRALHTTVGRALERVHAGRLDRAYDRLAHHYARSDDTEKAVEYLARFAEQTARNNAHLEAVTALEQALAHAERLPAGARDGRIVDLSLRLARSLSFLGRFRDTVELLGRSEERVRQLDDPHRGGPYHFTLGLTYSFLGEQEHAGRCAERALAEARRSGDENTLGKAYALMSLEGVWSGRPEAGIEHGRRAVELLERRGQRYWLAQAHLYMAFNHYIIGEITQGLAAAARAGSIGEAIGHRGTRSYAAWTSGGLHALSGDWEAAIRECRRGLELSPDPLTTAQAMGFLGYAYMENGEPAQAIPFLEQSIEILKWFRFRQEQGWFMAVLAEALLQAGDPERAIETATTGLEVATAARYRLGMGWGQRALGRIAQARGDVVQAAARLAEALDTFAAIPARIETARTHLALARLARTAPGDRGRERGHLAAAAQIFGQLQTTAYQRHTARLADDLEAEASPE